MDDDRFIINADVYQLFSNLFENTLGMKNKKCKYQQFVKEFSYFQFFRLGLFSFPFTKC